MDHKAGYSMFGPKVGSKGLVLRLGLEVGSRGEVPSHGWVPYVHPTIGFQGLGLKVGSHD